VADQPDTPDRHHTAPILGILQAGDPRLHEPATPFDLPTEADQARQIAAQLHALTNQIIDAYSSHRGLGLAAPQLGITRAAIIIRPHKRPPVTLLNPRIIEASVEEISLYEGCLSFFHVRGLVPRPKVIDVEHQDLDGQLHITRFRNGAARLVAHETDHLHGILYTAHMHGGSQLVPLEQLHNSEQAPPGS
jgi:peptide deformylase